MPSAGDPAEVHRPECDREPARARHPDARRLVRLAGGNPVLPDGPRLAAEHDGAPVPDDQSHHEADLGQHQPVRARRKQGNSRDVPLKASRSSTWSLIPAPGSYSWTVAWSGTDSIQPFSWIRCASGCSQSGRLPTDETIPVS